MLKRRLPPPTWADWLTWGVIIAAVVYLAAFVLWPLVRR